MCTHNVTMHINIKLSTYNISDNNVTINNMHINYIYYIMQNIIVSYHTSVKVLTFPFLQKHIAIYSLA